MSDRVQATHLHCRRCSEPLAPDDVFCAECGTPTEDRPATAAEIVKALTPSMTPRHGGVVMETLAEAPEWIPWSIAAVMTVIAAVMSALYFTR